MIDGQGYSKASPSPTISPSFLTVNSQHPRLPHCLLCFRHPVADLTDFAQLCSPTLQKTLFIPRYSFLGLLTELRREINTFPVTYLGAEHFALCSWRRRVSWGMGVPLNPVARVSFPSFQKEMTSSCPIGMESTPSNLGKRMDPKARVYQQHHFVCACWDITYLDGVTYFG